MKKDDIAKQFSEFAGAKDMGSKRFLDRFTKKLNLYFEKQYHEKSILGIDIFKYSKMETVGQTVIPYVFSEIYNETIRLCLDRESLFFGNKNNDWFKSNYIDTGDGCFQIFDHPLQALSFAVNFQSMIRLLNTGDYLPLISMAINSPLTTRYVITTDAVMEYENKYYGPGIINNARIISCDKLNRLLIDNATYEWFLLNTNGIETLQGLITSDFHELDPVLYTKDGISLLIKDKEEKLGILRTDIQQIESVNIKNDSFKIYSLHLQIALKKTNGLGLSKMIVSIGNLNTSGLAKEI